MRNIFANILLIVFFLFSGVFLYSQDTKKLPPYYRPSLNVDSLIKHTPYGIIFYPEVIIYPKKSFASQKEQKQYEKLVRNFIKVYPYAIEITKLYIQLEDSLAKFPTDKEKKKYLKLREKQIMAYYKPQLVKFTISQSVLLVRLLDRESGSTAYEIIDELKGSVKAFFWQGFAIMFGNDLKHEYDSSGKDRDIEELIRRYNEGSL